MEVEQETKPAIQPGEGVTVEEVAERLLSPGAEESAPGSREDGSPAPQQPSEGVTWQQAGERLAERWKEAGGESEAEAEAEPPPEAPQPPEDVSFEDYRAAIQSEWQDVESDAAALNAEIEGVDLAELKEDNPKKFRALEQRYNRIQERAEQVQRAAQFVESTAQLRELRGREHKALLDKLPEWKNIETRTKESRAAAEALKSVGYTDDEISRTVDHRAILLARKAAQADGLLSSGKRKLTLPKKKSKQAHPQPKARQPMPGHKPPVLRFGQSKGVTMHEAAARLLQGKS